MEANKIPTLSPKLESEKIHKLIINKEYDLIFGFFEKHLPPDKISKEEYLDSLLKEYCKRKKERIEMLDKRFIR